MVFFLIVVFFGGWFFLLLGGLEGLLLEGGLGEGVDFGVCVFRVLIFMMVGVS